MLIFTLFTCGLEEEARRPAVALAMVASPASNRGRTRSGREFESAFDAALPSSVQAG